MIILINQKPIEITNKKKKKRLIQHLRYLIREKIWWKKILDNKNNIKITSQVGLFYDT